MTASVSAFLAQVRQRGAELPPALTGALLLAAVRLSEEKSLAVRPELLLVGEDGALELIDGPRAPADEDNYAAPELRRGSAPPRDPRVLVFAAGALGYELATLFPLADEAGPELTGALAPVIRRAVSPERKRRYRNLEEMAKAIEEVQARPSEEEERLILAAVASTSAPPAKRLAKVELTKMAVPSPYAPDAQSEHAETPPQVHPVFAQRWDPLEAPPAVFFESAEQPEAGVVEMGQAEAQEAREPVPMEQASEPPAEQTYESPEQAQGDVPAAAPDDLAAVRAELKERREEILVLESRLENLARLGTRISALEERLKEAPAPAVAARPAMEEPRFADALRAAVRAQKRRGTLLFAGGAVAGALGAGVVALTLRGPARVDEHVPVHEQVHVDEQVPVHIHEHADEHEHEHVDEHATARVEEKAEARPSAEKPRPPPPPREPRPRKTMQAASAGNRAAAAEAAAKGDKALRSFNTADALASFESALKLDATLPAAHRGMGMVYVLQGKNAEAKVEYQKYLQLAPDAADADQIKRLLAR